ncbi:hypothetical protein [Streptomyces sp. cg35]|uniref:hypothetical protein n=1 Tax=Streptomyces sp. cg35 TaxID=3421650 RepID=UPI003D184D54
MIMNRKGRERFLDAVTGFETAVREQDGARSEQEFQKIHRHFGDAKQAEIDAGAPRLAALLTQLPAGPRGMVAVTVGACVERGADAGRCAPALLDGLADAVRGAGEFCARWTETGGGDLPDPETDAPDDAVLERVGPEPAMAWWTLPQWEMAAVAMLNHPAVRTGLDPAVRTGLLTSLRAVQEASGHDFKCLTYALLVLDDAPLVVLHRESGAGFALRMTGIGDNFQLHTLLADVLAGGGHVAARVPSAQEAAVCRDAPGQVPTTGSFNLAAPDGGWIWNEGTPSDIPVVDGARLLVLDPPPYERGWPAGRFFPGMTGDLTLERVLGADETARWFTHVQPAT